MPLLMTPTLYLVALLLLTNIVAIAGWGVTNVRLNNAKEAVATCKANHEAFVLQAKAQGELAERKAKQIEQDNERIADETAKGWAKALDVVRADSRRVRLVTRNPGSREMPGIRAPAERVDAAPEGTLPAPERVIADCQEDVLKLVWLQNWITETRSNE